MTVVNKLFKFLSLIKSLEHRHTIRINIKPLFLFATFLVFFQLFVSLLSTITLPFVLLISFGSLFSILLTWFSSNLFDLTVKLSVIRLLLNLAFLFIFTKTFIGLLNYHIMDIIYPTNLLGMVTQVARGRFPASFISFPEFPANYHQGFLIVSGTYSYLSKISPIIAIRHTFIWYFLCLNILLLFFFQKFARNAIFGLFPLFIATISGFSNSSVYGSKYISDELSFFEYLSAKTVPDSFIVILLLTLYLWKIKNILTYRSMIVIAFYILSCSAINASTCSFLVLTATATVAFYLYKEVSVSNYRIIHLFSKISAFLAILFIIWLLPKYFPSAYLKGSSYGAITLRPRYTDPNWKEFLICYFRLAGPFIYIGLALSVAVLIRTKYFNIRSSLAILTLGSFIFPIIVYIGEIQTWDNAHKPLLVSFFCTILLMATQFRHAKWLVSIGGIACVLLVKPVFIDLYSHRQFPYPRDDQEIYSEIQDISTYLFHQNSDVILLPFGNPLCSEHPDPRMKEFSRIAGASGQFARNNYAFVFLISGEVYKNYVKNMYWWKDAGTFNQSVTSMKSNELIIVYNQDINKFMNLYETSVRSLPVDQRYVLKVEKAFEYYTLLKKG